MFKRLTATKNKNLAIGMVVVFVVTVAGLTYFTLRAAGYFVAVEAENSALSGGASIINDTSAAGGAAVQFAASTPAPTMRAVNSPMYGMTVDDVANITNIVDAAKSSSKMLTTRIVFDEGVRANYYTTAVNALQPYSYVMGELTDSYYLKTLTTQQYSDRVAEYLSTLGSKVDIWEVGNEVNGNWTGAYSDVSAKIVAAHNLVKAAGKQSALTLYYDIGCGNGPTELDPIAFTKSYVPEAMRNSLDYVLLSYYETDCNNIRPSAATWTDYFNQLHQLYPNAKLGFGEVGLSNPATSATLSQAQSMLNYYYNLKISTPNYIGGYFWWYAYEDFLPVSANKPLWQAFQTAIKNY